ncbi:MBL fold metallo-hydrolase RNA specificity domain-containing protein [Phycicoccus ginsengisoli]
MHHRLRLRDGHRGAGRPPPGQPAAARPQHGRADRDQAVGTRGRSLQEGARELKVLGRYVRVRAEVVLDDTFSVHADADELVSWLDRLPRTPEVVHLVHGEPESRQALARRIREHLDCAVALPRLGERVVL